MTLKPFERVSASQISNFKSCNRLWWWEYIFGLKAPQRSSAALGEMTHKFLENYLIDGTMPDRSYPAGKIAMLGISQPGMLPEPKTSIVEINMRGHEANSLRLAGLEVSGRIDYLIPSLPFPEVGDHKTTSNLAYAKTAEELARDPQMIIYGKFTLSLLTHAGIPFRDIAGVKLTHVVYPTRGVYTSAKKTSVSLTPQEVEEQWSHIDPVVAEMRKAALQVKPDDVEPNWNACSKYGGCHFKDKCEALRKINPKPRQGLFATPTEQKQRLFQTPPTTPVFQKQEKTAKENNMGALQELMAKKRAESAAAAPAVPVPAPLPKSTPSEGSGVHAPASVTPPAPAAEPSISVAPPTQSQVDLLARYGLKPSSPSPTPVISILPPDAPGVAPAAPQSLTVAAPKTEAAPAPASQPEASGVTRRPRGYKAKLTPLGWSEKQIELMSADTMANVIDKSLTSDGYSIRADGSLQKVGEDTNENASPVTPEAVAVALTSPDELPYVVSLPGGPDGLPEASDAASQVAGSSSEDEEDEVKEVSGLVIYVDCFPLKGPDANRPKVMLEEHLAPFMAKAATLERVAHYSLIGFGKGPSYLAAFMLSEPPRGVVICSTRSPATNACLEVLMPMASRVIKAW